MTGMLRKILDFGSLVLAGLLLLAAAICLVNPHQALFHLIDIFSVALLSTSVLVTLLLLWAKQRPAGLMAGLASLMLVLAVWPQAFPHQAPPDRTHPPLRLVFGNLYINNGRPERLLPWVDQEKPDVVAMVETNPFARQALMAALAKTYPYRIWRYDMVVASRYPLSHFQPRPAGFALVTVDIATPDGRLTLAVAHLTRPWPFKPAEDQMRQFDRLADSVAGSFSHRFVLVGDFNAPPLASGLRDFTRRTGLHTAPALPGTWPAFLPGLFRVGIDNALASPDISLQGRKVGGFDGSDHRPIFVEIYPANVR